MKRNKKKKRKNLLWQIRNEEKRHQSILRSPSIAGQNDKESSIKRISQYPREEAAAEKEGGERERKKKEKKERGGETKEEQGGKREKEREKAIPEERTSEARG